MAVVLSPQVQAYVQGKMRATSALPSYYDAETQQNVQISRDFEAFLIVSDDSLKTSALSWIQKATQITQVNQLRDSLVQLGLAQELKNAQARVAEYNNQLQDFSTFRANFQTQTAFAGVPEVQLFLSDLQAMIGELSVGLDRATFDQNVSNILIQYGDNTEVTEGQVEELQSWTSVISAYLS